MRFFSDINGANPSGVKVTIGDDQISSIPLPEAAGFVGIIRFDFPNANFAGFFAYDSGRLFTLGVATAGVVDNQDNAVLEAGTDPPGNDNDMVVAVNSGYLVIKNRTGGTRTFKVVFL